MFATFAMFAMFAMFATFAPLLAAQQPSAPGPALRAVPIDRVVAVVGTRPILWSEVTEAINVQRGQGLQLPPDSAGQMAVARDVLNSLIDEEVLIDVAKQFKVAIVDADVTSDVEKRIKEVKGGFKSDAEFRDAMRRNGFGNEGEFRKFLLEQNKRQLLQQRAMDSLRARGRLSAPVSVSEEDVTAAFEKAKGRLPKRPATISFRQIVVAPKPNSMARKAALAKAESLAVEISKGGDFEKIAKRESMDPGSKETGGDLGWNRRGQMVPEFDRMMFALAPGQVSPVVETSLGFHIIKVDRVQPAEVKARHILIMPHLDSSDVVRARLTADTVVRLWKSGALFFDSLVARYHDNAELKSYPDGYEVEKLPDNYKQAVEGLKAGQFTAPFDIPNPRTGFPKIGVLQVTDRVVGGDYTVADMRDRIRQQLQQERSIRRALDQLRREYFVSVRM